MQEDKEHEQTIHLLNSTFIKTKIVEVDLFVWEVFSDVVNTDYRFTKVVIAWCSHKHEFFERRRWFLHKANIKNVENWKTWMTIPGTCFRRKTVQIGPRDGYTYEVAYTLLLTLCSSGLCTLRLSQTIFQFQIQTCMNDRQKNFLISMSVHIFVQTKVLV